MSRIRKIERNPKSTNYYIIDACFLANRYIPTNDAQFATLRGLQEKSCIEECKSWWKEIDSQLRRGKAIVYIPDICIAEAFKVLAKMYYRRKAFASAVSYNKARNRLSKDITTPIKDLKLADRQIGYHDVSTSRDIIIAVDRFLEVFMKKNCRVSLPDLIVLATAKYLIDFFRIPASHLFVITLDKQLHRGSRLIRDIPSTFNPSNTSESAKRIFVGDID